MLCKIEKNRFFLKAWNRENSEVCHEYVNNVRKAEDQNELQIDKKKLKLTQEDFLKIAFRDRGIMTGYW